MLHYLSYFNFSEVKDEKNKKILLEIFLKMAKNEEGDVRKFVSMNLKRFFSLLPKAPEKELIGLLKTLFNDKEEYVKTYNIESLLELCRKVKES